MTKKTKLENMTVKEIETEITLNLDRREELFKQKDPLDRKLVRLSKRNTKLGDQIANIRSNAKTVDWKWLLHASHNENSMEKYRLREKKLAEINLRSQGFFHEIEQVQVCISLIRNDIASLPDTMKGLKKILKHIKPMKGYKRFDIAESTFSEFGVYELLIDEENNKYNIQLTKWSSPKIIDKFDNLKEALVKIQHTYFYEDALTKLAKDTY